MNYTPHLFDAEEVEEILADLTLGEAIDRALSDVKSPFSALLTGARNDYVTALSALLDADLHTTEGIDNARRIQATAQRYRDMCRYIAQAQEAAEAASEQQAQVEQYDTDEPAIEELKDQIHGTRSKPAPDA